MAKKNITKYEEELRPMDIPEALEGPPHTLAVQWHPEWQAKDPLQSKLFKYFIRMVRRSEHFLAK